MNHFSIPMPFDSSLIEKAVSINQHVSKSRIATMYNCLPFNAKGKSGFEQNRMTDSRVENLDEFLRLVELVQKKDISFVYLMNSLRTISYRSFYRNERKFRKFVQTLLSNGITGIRAASPLLIDYLQCNFPKIQIFCSTSQEYHSIRQYRNLICAYPNIIEVIPSWDENRNFEFLESFVQSFPSMSIELMVNEGCVSGCPFRLHHSLVDPDSRKRKNTRFLHFFTDECSKIIDRNFWLRISMLNVIYPWQIETYNEIGINHFKLVGRNSLLFHDGSYLDIYESYLKGVDDVNLIIDQPIFMFNNNFCNSHILPKYTVRELISLLPNIKYFQTAKPRCGDHCGVHCRVCYDCAQKIQDIYPH